MVLAIENMCASFFFLLLTFHRLVVEFATVGQTKDGKIYHHLWGADEINALLKQHGLAKEEDSET